MPPIQQRNRRERRPIDRHELCYGRPDRVTGQMLASLHSVHDVTAGMRKGSTDTARSAERFVRETVGRVRRAGATLELTVRADSGYPSRKVISACVDHDDGFSISDRQTGRMAALTGDIDDDAWADIDYTDRGEAQVAEPSGGGGD